MSGQFFVSQPILALSFSSLPIICWLNCPSIGRQNKGWFQDHYSWHNLCRNTVLDPTHDIPVVQSACLFLHFVFLTIISALFFFSTIIHKYFLLFWDICKYQVIFASNARMESGGLSKTIRATDWNLSCFLRDELDFGSHCRFCEGALYSSPHPLQIFRIKEQRSLSCVFVSSSSKDNDSWACKCFSPSSPVSANLDTHSEKEAWGLWNPPSHHPHMFMFSNL